MKPSETKAPAPGTAPCRGRQEQLERWATGDLGPIQVWLLRRHLDRCPACAREWEAVQDLYADLRAIRAIPLRHATPAWAEELVNMPPRRPVAPATITLGGLTMNRRAALIAGIVLTLGSVSGVYAARQWLYDPFHDMPAPGGHTWRAEGEFLGEVKFYGPDGSYSGSTSNSSGHGGSVAAVVTVDGDTRFTLSGAGRHELRHPETGKLLGYADLVPQTPEEREQARRSEYEGRAGIQKPLKISHGCNDGYGTAVGFFGGEEARINWRLTGVARINFRYAQTGELAYFGTAAAVTPEQRAQLRRSLAPPVYATLVAERVPDAPVFEWTEPNGNHGSTTGFGACSLTLPDGTELTAEVTPLPGM